MFLSGLEIGFELVLFQKSQLKVMDGLKIMGGFGEARLF